MKKVRSKGGTKWFHKMLNENNMLLEVNMELSTNTIKWVTCYSWTDEYNGSEKRGSAQYV